MPLNGRADMMSHSIEAALDFSNEQTESWYIAQHRIRKEDFVILIWDQVRQEHTANYRRPELIQPGGKHSLH